MSAQETKSIQPARVAWIVEHLRDGGVQRGMLQQFPLLDHARFAPVVVYLRRHGDRDQLRPDFEAAGIELKFVSVRDDHDRRGVRELARFLAEQRVQLVHAYGVYGSTVGRIAAQLADSPVSVAHLHGVYTYKWDRSQVAWERVLFERTTLILTVARAIEDVYFDATRLPRGRSRALYIGLDLEALRRAAPNSEPFRERGAGPDDTVLLAVGRLTAEKGYDVLLDAAAEIARAGKPFKLFLVGEGPERENLLARVAELELNDRVHLLGRRTDVPALMKAADIVVHPSFAEGTPRIVLEAMACGTPVVATDAGGTREILEHERQGVIVPPRDAAALARATLQLIDEPDRRAELAAAAARRVEEFSLEQWTRRTEALYEELLAPAAKPALHVLSDMKLRLDQFLLACRYRWERFKLKSKTKK